MLNTGDCTRRISKRIDDRIIDELIGLAGGLTADDVVNQKEAEFLLDWLNHNRTFVTDPVIETLYARLCSMLEDKILDDEEQKELLQTLRGIQGEQTENKTVNLAAIFPLDIPAPDICFPDHTFCLTGTFAYGPRTFCTEIIKEKFGRVSSNVTLKTDYLVIGNFCSDGWIHSSYGRKIEKAMEYRDQCRTGIQIVHEDYWTKFLTV